MSGIFKGNMQAWMETIKLWIRRSCIMWLIEVIRQINVIKQIVMRQVMKIEQTGKTFLRKSRNWYQNLSEKINKN